jgi:hypothetical protein
VGEPQSSTLSDVAALTNHRATKCQDLTLRLLDHICGHERHRERSTTQYLECASVLLLGELAILVASAYDQHEPKKIDERRHLGGTTTLLI